MKKIIVAIDFSESSKNTFDHALSIATKFKAKLLLLWVENSKSLKHLNYTKEVPLENFIDEKFHELISTITDKDIVNNIEKLTSKGDPASQVVTVAKKENAELIVVGTHGTHGFRRYLTGSSANKIVASAHCPVITIRPNRDLSKELNVIVIPIDGGLDTRQKLPIATRIAKYFNAEIHLLGLYFNKADTVKRRVVSYTEQSEKYLISNGVSKIVIHYTSSTDGARTILNYAKKVDAGLIAVMIEAEMGGSSFSLQSQGKQFINQSPIPILSIANKELMRTAPKM